MISKAIIKNGARVYIDNHVFSRKKNLNSSENYTSEEKNCAPENYPFRMACDFIIMYFSEIIFRIILPLKITLLQIQIYILKIKKYCFTLLI